MDARPEPVDAARRVVAERWPDAAVVLLAGSAGTARATATSDLDLVVVLDGPPAPYRDTFRAHGWLVEAFVHTPASLVRFWDRETAAGRSPLLVMVAEGRVVVDRDGGAAALQAEARRRRDAGPGPADLDLRRYMLTALLDDLADTPDAGTVAVVAAGVLTSAGELALAAQGRWLGTGKWLVRELRDADAGLAADLLAAHRVAVADGDVSPLVTVGRRVLDRVGGPLDVGFRRDGDPPAPPR